MPDHQDRVATKLLLIARNPHTGRLRHPGVLDIGLRAALLAELVLQGRVVEENGGPYVDHVTDSGDRILDAVARAVERRPNVPWWRWFRHVRADRVALAGELVDGGRWTRRSGGLRRSYDDTDEAATGEMAYSALRVVEHQRTADDARDGLLAVTAAMCGAVGGRPQHRSLRRELKPIVDRIANSGEPGAEVLPRLLAGASLLSRRPLRR